MGRKDFERLPQQERQFLALCLASVVLCGVLGCVLCRVNDGTCGLWVCDSAAVPGGCGGPEHSGCAGALYAARRGGKAGKGDR